METIMVCKRGVITTRPEDSTTCEVYSDERVAEFLLTNAVDAGDYEAARREVTAMGLDPDCIQYRAIAKSL